MMAATEFGEDLIVAAHALSQPLTNSRNGSGAHTGLLFDFRISDASVDQLRNLPSFGHFKKFSFCAEVPHKVDRIVVISKQNKGIHQVLDHGKLPNGIGGHPLCAFNLSCSHMFVFVEGRAGKVS